MDNPIQYHFEDAANYIEKAVTELENLRGNYMQSSLPDRKARIRALDAKIDALEAVQLNAKALPWCEDSLDTA